MVYPIGMALDNNGVRIIDVLLNLGFNELY